MRKLIMQTIASFLAVIPIVAGASPILNIDENGLLMGASDVDVAGMLFSVEFVDGTCAGIFNGCDDASDFAFSTIGEARAAAQALLDTVFIDGTFGYFDTDPTRVAGCPGSPNVLGSCLALIPYSSTLITGQNGDQSFNVSANNRPLNNSDVIGGSSTHLDLYHTGDCRPPHFCRPSWAPYSTWAVWSPQVITAPESGTLILLGSGLLGFSLARRKKNA